MALFCLACVVGCGVMSLLAWRHYLGALWCWEDCFRLWQDAEQARRVGQLPPGEPCEVADGGYVQLPTHDLGGEA